jgi:hypothetical protein
MVKDLGLVQVPKGRCLLYKYILPVKSARGKIVFRRQNGAVRQDAGADWNIRVSAGNLRNMPWFNIVIPQNTANYGRNLSD